MQLNLKLKKIRECKNITLSEVAEALSWPVSKLSKIEDGSKDITYKDLQDLCMYLDESINDMIEEKKLQVLAMIFI